jgi:hypothetical protein
MADTNVVTQYQVTGGIGNDSFGFNLTTDGLTDEAILALGEAIKNVPWPTGVNCSVWIFKSIQTTVTTQGNLAAVPPAFTQ